MTANPHASIQSKVYDMPDLKASDSSIKQNIIFQCILALVLTLFFIPLRKSFLWLYAPNTRKKKNHPAYSRSKSTFTWFLPVITVSDVEILSVIGLDSFMVLQTLKLMYRICFTIFLSLIPLVYTYYHGEVTNTHKQLYIRFTIKTLKKQYYFIPLIYIYLITFFVFYMMYIYYKKHVVLRQAYIRAPSIMTPLSILKRLSFDNENYSEMINIRSRSVFLKRIPSFIKNDNELRVFVEALGCGMVDKCVLIKDTTIYETLTDERDYLIRDIECEIEKSMVKITKAIKNLAKTDENMKTILDGLNEVTLKGIQRHIEYEDLVDVEDEDKENVDLAKLFLFSKNKYIKRVKNVDVLTYKMWKLEIVQDKLNEEIKELNAKPSNSKPNEVIIDLMNENNELYTRVQLNDDVSFFSFGQMIQLKENYHSFTLDLPIKTNSGFISFLDPKSAQILPQCLISSRVFTCKAIPAPSPQDVIWSNINQGEIRIYFKKLITSLLFILFNFMFYTAAFGLIEMIQLDSLRQKFDWIRIITERKTIRNSFDGIVTPLMFNTLLSISPIILTTLIYYEGVSSYSLLHYRLMIKYGYFLIYNGFLMIFLFSATNTNFKTIWCEGKIDIEKLARSFGANLVAISVFFINAIIQRLVLGNLIIILKPVKLFIVVFLGRIHRIFGSVMSRRNVCESKAPISINFGDVYPNLLLVFPMALTFSIISPLMILLAGVYYFVTYFVYKSEFLYSFINNYESGGTHWCGVAKMIIISLFILQITTICHFFLNTQKIEAILLIPLIIITFMYSSALEGMFGKSVTYYALNEQEELHTDAFTSHMVALKKDVVKDWVEEMDPDDPTVIRCDNIVGKVCKKKIHDYPYRGAVEGLDCIMFPDEFFKKMRIIKKLDPDDTLEIFKCPE